MPPEYWSADTFLTFATWDDHTHGTSDHRMYDAAAGRILRLRPEIAHDSLFTAIVCGDLEEVRRRLAADPNAAIEAGGPRKWTPLLYLAYTRFTHQPTFDHAVAIARELLDRGANANDYYDAYQAKYSALVGIAGGGEQESPRQPQSEALFQLLLERGAEPFDQQVLYNTHFHNDFLWWLNLIYDHSMKTGREAATPRGARDATPRGARETWRDPNWAMLDMGGYGSGARFLLGRAIEKGDVALAEWALSRGASPNAPPARDRRYSKRSLHDDAVAMGQPAIADLLLQHGATPTDMVLSDDDAFVSACMREDRAAVEALVKRHPKYVTSHEGLFAAAGANQAGAVAMLIDLGTPVNIRDESGQTALHDAAANNALGAIQVLIDRGAEIDPVESTYQNVPLGWAQHFEHKEAMVLLSRHSKHVWALAFGGYVDRLREVLAENPALAKSVRTDDGSTPLWWLPIDEGKALEVVKLLLAAGADPAVKNKNGNTADKWAMRMGMPGVAELLSNQLGQRAEGTGQR